MANYTGIIEFLRYGDKAVLVNFEQKIEMDIHQQVNSFWQQIEQSNFEAIEYCIPAYCSIMVGYNPKIASATEVISLIKKLSEKNKTISQPTENTSRTIYMPVCYARDFALDLSALSEQLELSPSEIIRLHIQESYRVFMLGFLPGFPYMGIVPKELACQRKAIPRQQVPAGSVGLAGVQTGIYPSDSPGGWQIIGKTPLPIFRPEEANPFLLKIGDTLQFQEISANSFQKIARDIRQKVFKWEEIYA